MTEARPRMRIEETSENQPVTTLELFFDLVFVFALTQITAQMSHELSWHSLLRGMMLLALMWWSWVGYAWLCNLVKADEGSLRLALLVAMGSMFLIALTIPEAFHDMPGGLPGPVVIAVAYFLLRLTHLVLFWIISAGDAALRRTLAAFALPMLGGTTLLLVASQFHGATQTALWAAALATDILGTALVDPRGWRLRSPGHFAERHGLIVIVGLGESIVAIGVGVAALPISWPIVVGSILALTVASALWWIYFDMAALYGEQALAGEPAETRPWLARDAYSFAHLPLVAGIVLLALGFKKVLEYVGDSEHHHLTDPLKGVGLVALFAGTVVYLLGHVAFKWRTTRRLSPGRLGAAVLLLVALPLVGKIPALAQLGVVAAILVALVVFETIRYADDRAALRHAH